MARDFDDSGVPSEFVYLNIYGESYLRHIFGQFRVSAKLLSSLTANSYRAALLTRPKPCPNYGV